MNDVNQNFKKNNSSYDISKESYLPDVMQIFFDTIDSTTLTFEEVTILIKEMRDGNQEARVKLIEHNTKLVKTIAQRYMNHGLDFEDLFQEGSIGLMIAIDRFDPNKGYQFSTYAAWWIWSRIARAIADQGRIIRIPVYQMEAILKLSKTNETLSKNLSKTPTNDELAKSLNVTKKYIEDLLKINQSILSTNLPIGDVEYSNGDTIADIIVDQTSISPVKEAVNGSLKETLDYLLKTLSERESQVLKMRNGYYNQKCYTLEEVGEKYGITRERVRQIEKGALKKLKIRGKKISLREFLQEDFEEVAVRSNVIK